MSGPVLKQAATRAGWSMFDLTIKVLGAAILAGIGFVFHTWIVLHWTATLVFFAVSCVIGLCMFLWAKVRYKKKLAEHKAEFDAFRTDVFADVVLASLKECKGRVTFMHESLAKNLHLPSEHVLAAIQSLHNRGFLAEVPGGGWEFKPEDWVNVTPYFCRHPNLQERLESAHA